MSGRVHLFPISDSIIVSVAIGNTTVVRLCTCTCLWAIHPKLADTLIQSLSDAPQGKSVAWSSSYSLRSKRTLCNFRVIVSRKRQKNQENARIDGNRKMLELRINQLVKKIVEVFRILAQNTQNPVRATSCRFDSDLRHLENQLVMRSLLLPHASSLFPLSVFCPCFCRSK